MVGLRPTPALLTQPSACIASFVIGRFLGFDSMLIDLTCPVEIFRTDLPTSGIPAVSLILFNLSDRVITSAEVTAVLLTASGNEKEKVVFRGRALNGRPHSTFNMNVPMNPEPAAKQAEVRIEKVWFSDNDVWRRADGAETEYTPNALPASPALVNLKYAAGETAVGYPSQQENLWVCVCGRPNPNRENYCARCRRDKASVFAMFNRETVENRIALREKQLELNTRSAREDTARLQRIREKEYRVNRSRLRRRVMLALCLALFLAICAGMMGGAVPALRLASANRDMKAGNYDSAREQYRDLGGFSGVEEKIDECNWQLIAEEAAELMDGWTAESAPDGETIRDLSARLRKTGRAEGVQTADEIDLRRARMLLEEAREQLAAELPEKEEGVPEVYRDGVAVPENDPASVQCRRLLKEARQAAAEVDPESEERTNLETECLYLEAQDAMNRGEYLTARETFRSLGDYEQAAAFARECLYQQGLKLLEAGRYQDAIDTLSPMMDYRDSRNRVLQCHCLIGDLYAEEGRLEEACDEYFQAGEWSSAKAKYQSITYKMAEEAYLAENYEKALELCSSIPGHPDADRMNWDCRYRLGKAAFAENEYTTAYRMFSGLPDDYAKDVAALRVQAAYHAGKLAMKLENWDLASELMTAAGDYSDAEKQMKIIREKLIELYPELAPPEEAEENPDEEGGDE